MPIRLTSALIIDGSGDSPYTGEVVIDGDLIKATTCTFAQLSEPGDEVINCRGRTIMPGLTEAHCHISFNNIVSMESVVAIQPEDHALIALANAQLLLQRGFTSLYSAASAKPRLDVAVRDAITGGLFEGPRIHAASQEISPSGNLGDLDTNYLTLSRNIRFTVTCDGPEEFTKAARLAARNGVDSIKVNVSGDPDWGHMHADDKTPVISERELAAVAEVSATRLWALEGELEVTARCMSDLKRRGVRVLPGGDYGAFITNPIGNNAKDLELFVELSGFSPMQAIAAATRHGGQLMRKGDQLGLIKAGYQADLLVVDGNPLDDIRILQEPERLQAIMIAGKFAKRSHKLSQSPAFKAEHN